MKEYIDAGQLINELSFTNKEIAEYTGLKEVTIRKIRSGARGTSLKSAEKITEFLEYKITMVQAQIVQYKRILSKEKDLKSQA